MFTGLGWRSLDPREAVAAVHGIEDRDLLLQVAHEAMHPEARRMALIKLDDKYLTEAFALNDPSPIVRRRMVRMISDREVLEEIIGKDDDSSVTDAAYSRLRYLEEQERNAKGV